MESIVKDQRPIQFLVKQHQHPYVRRLSRPGRIGRSTHLLYGLINFTRLKPVALGYLCFVGGITGWYWQVSNLLGLEETGGGPPKSCHFPVC